MPRVQYKIAGYLIDFDVVKRVMERLGAPDKGAIGGYLCFPINDWPAKTETLNVLAGAMYRPGTPLDINVENCIMLCSTKIRATPLTSHPASELVELPQTTADLEVKQ